MLEAKRKKTTTARSIAPINRARPLHEEVVDRLRDMIIEGEIGVGDRLHEIGLSEILNVSRTPLREAVKLLATEGLVELLPGRGARVAALSPDDVEELFEVISGLERLAAELAAARMTARDLERLQRMHEKMAVHFQKGERHEYFAINHAIHEAIVAAAKNAMLSATHASLMAKARRGRYTALASDARWREAMAEHETLMQALAKRDGKLAGDILFEHDRRTGETTREILKSAKRSGPV
ncbi:DNA-binding GntR family transcriptional regulator [Rhizobium sp. BK313]|uniref:GntR family transcriptional regulator n=1 Tax=Rhizobium sp. BK313 TaxID=2587081 RepID=UPI0010D39EFB|nr:GntR family transcriptional regulator [Rhizobium sp. BK313]MBB3459017.1 DNA-binding GntR family transcriptional regulator [Rhizobium sp. BK313]